MSFNVFRPLKPAFKERNFRWYFYGQAPSFLGTWMQNAAVAWWIANASIHSKAEAVGFNGALLFIPMFFAPIGGIFIDKFGPRKTMFVTVALGITQALTLAFMEIAHATTITELNILTLVLGIINIVDAPCRSALLQHSIARETLPSANGVNGILIHTSMGFGPMAAIAIMKTAPDALAWVFILNAISFLPMAFALTRIKTDNARSATSVKELLSSGFSYIKSNPLIRKVFLLGGACALFGDSVRTTFPIIAQTQHKPELFSWFAWSLGIGSVCGAALFPFFVQKATEFRCIFQSFNAMSMGLLIFGVFPNTLALSIPALFISGMGLAITVVATLVKIQKTTDKQMIGRVMTLYGAIFFGSIGVGNFLVGFFCQTAGYVTTIIGCAVLLSTACQMVPEADRQRTLNTREAGAN